MPQPPERVLAPVEPAPPVATATPPADTPRTPPRPTPSPAPPREAEQRPAAPTPTPPPTTPPPTTQTDATRDLRPAAANSAAAERAVRDVLVRANRDLVRIDYGKLSTDGRAQYEQSKRFSQQAEQALKERNVVFAATLADKAATLAAELLGR